MAWQQLTLDVPEDSERIESLLANFGAVSICIQDGGDEDLLEPAPGETPMWSCPRLTALFDGDVDRDLVILGLQSAGVRVDCCWTPLENREWERVWLDDFKPMRFGRHLWVCPTTCRPPVDDGTVIYLDPGLAFGTGRHATTALCLEWLEQTPLSDRKVIDYGCGSGILAIAAALLGAGKVVAVDLDEQALTATRENAERNGVADKIDVYQPADMPVTPGDVLVANILAQPLVDLSATFATLVVPGGRIALSGILDDQPGWVSPAYHDHFEMEPPTSRAGWARLTGTRKRVHTVPTV